MCELKSCDSNHLKGGHPDDPEYSFVKEFFLDFYQIELTLFLTTPLLVTALSLLTCHPSCIGCGPTLQMSFVEASLISPQICSANSCCVSSLHS